ncbi:MAG: hypothetical protein M3P38_13110 [Chloroflexota bacterium]|nr:hypothetical protein [Chloroflexota bacterium]
MTTRRSAVSRALMALAGMAGIGAAGVGGAKLVPPSEPSALVLHGRNWRTVEGRLGELPTEGDRISVRGDLIDETHGKPIGEFYAAGFAIGGGSHPAHGERLELHTFKLRDGTIIGSGTAGQLEGTFAILGGTGSYASARGTYVARQRHQDFGGDGSAEFVLKLTR